MIKCGAGNNWSSDTSSDMAIVRVGEDPDKVGVGCGAGCEIGSTAVVHGAGDGMALVYPHQKTA